MLLDSFYWLNYSVLKQLQQILVLVHLLHLYLYQHFFFVLPSSFTVSGDNNSNLYHAFILKMILFLILLGVNLYGRIFRQSFVFFDDKFKVILNVWDWIWSIKQIKFIIPRWSRYFKFIVVVCRFNVFPGEINT